MQTLLNKKLHLNTASIRRRSSTIQPSNQRLKKSI